MTITDRVLHFLRVVRRYKFVTAAQIRDLCVPHDTDGSITRDVLRKMRDAGFIQRRQAEVVNPLSSSNAPVYLPTEAGCCLLATKTGDMGLLLDAVPAAAAWQNFAHNVAVSDLFIKLDRALASQERVRMTALYFEHDIIDPNAAEPSKKYRLYTIVKNENQGGQDRKIVCVPDAACEIEVGNFRRAYVWELERGTDTPRRVAAKKTPGYASFADHFRRIFPLSQDFCVVAVCPGNGWRDALRKEVTDKPGAALWRFVTLNDLGNDFLHAPVFFTCIDGPMPFVRPLAAPSAAPSAERSTKAPAERRLIG